MEALGLDATTLVLLVGSVTGFVEFAKAMFDKKWRTAVIVAGAAGVGALLSLALPFDLVTGIVGGLAASGAVTLSQNFGTRLDA